ncbi:Putative ribosome biogenesis GTPase RsgA [Candidatus Hepatincola sp. Pdp]
MNYLEKYGLDSFFTQQLIDENINISQIAKIIAIHKKYYVSINNQGNIIKALAKGNLLHHLAVSNADLPQIGDFIVLKNQTSQPNDDSFFIQKILQRKTVFKRKLVGKKQDVQILAVNVDYVFITMSLDHQFNLKRLERFLLATFDSNIIPIIILTKEDLTQDPKSFTKEITTNFPHVTTIVTSTLQPLSFNPIKDLLVNNKTAVLVGVSGSGKSTITNILLESEVQKVGAISQEKSKGKHTTTHREIFLLKSGGCIIDSPGIKEFGLLLDKNYNLNETFADILATAKLCKFRNCTHQNEPDCAIQAKIKTGEITQEHFNNYLYLLQEQQAETHNLTGNTKRKK